MGQRPAPAPLPPDDVVTRPMHSTVTSIDKAGSVLALADFTGPMTTSLTHSYRERLPGEGPETPISYLGYGAWAGETRNLSLQLPYAGEPATVDFGDVGASIGIWEGGADFWRGTGGRAIINPVIDGQLRVDVEGLVLKSGEATESVGGGFVTGKVTRVCLVVKVTSQEGSGLVDGNGNPPPPIVGHDIDRDWSSPFCAALKR